VIRAVLDTNIIVSGLRIVLPERRSQGLAEELAS